MQVPEKTWERKPQEKEGSYWFSGGFLITPGVKALLDEIEIMGIYYEIQDLVKKHNGLDYLQVYERQSDGTKLFFIDQLTIEQVQSKKFESKENYCTLMLASEY